MTVLGAGQIIPGMDLHIYELVNSNIILVHLVSISLARFWSWLPEPPTPTLLLTTFPEKVPLNFFYMEQKLTVTLQVGTSAIIPFPIIRTSLQISSWPVNGSVFSNIMLSFYLSTPSLCCGIGDHLLTVFLRGE